MRIIHSTLRHSTVSEPEPPKLIPAPLSSSSSQPDMEIPGLSHLVPFPHIPDYLNHQPWGRDDSDTDADGESEDEWDVVVEPPQLLDESFKPDGMISEKDEYDPVFSAHLDPSLLLLSRSPTPPFSPSLASNSLPTYPPNSPSPTESSPSPPSTTTISRPHRFSAARRHRRIIPIPTDSMMTPMSKKRLALALRRPSPGSLRKHELFKPEVMSLFNPRNPRTTGSPVRPNAPLSNENTPIMNMGTNVNNSMMMTPPLLGNPWSLGLGLGEGDEGQRVFIEGDVTKTSPPSPRPMFPHSPPVEPIDYTAWEQEILCDLPGLAVMAGGEAGEVNVSTSWLD